MDKGIGFNRKLQLNWLDAAAAYRLDSDDPLALRARLEPVVGQVLSGKEARRKTIDLLINIWHKTGDTAPRLHQAALDWYQTTAQPGDRLWLHYGLTLRYYAYFRECTAIIGQLSRVEPAITNKAVIARLAAKLGNVGSLERSTQRVVSSLVDWGILQPAAQQRYAYSPQRQAHHASDPELETWLLACALTAEPAEEIQFEDLINLPALFPFAFTLTAGALRRSPWFEVQRQGLGFEMVRLAQC